MASNQTDKPGLHQLSIRTIEEKDNPELAKLIRSTLAEFGANHPGTVYYDDSTDHLYTVFQQPRSVYYVAEWEGAIVGAGGIFPSPGLPPNTCELVKMYTYPQVRGIGLGKLLIRKCLDFAKAAGYEQVYIETMPELKQAMKVYEKFGFVYLDQPMGNTGHFGCDIWMLKKL